MVAQRRTHRKETKSRRLTAQEVRQMLTSGDKLHQTKPWLRLAK